MDRQTHPYTKRSGPVTSGGSTIMEKEHEIREQLEDEVERALEDEIKDGIYRLALRLGRLYETKKERTLKSKQGNYGPCEVNISIKMDGGTKVEIRERKSETRAPMGTPRLLLSSRSSASGKRPDWARSLRSRGSGSVAPKSLNMVKKKEPFRLV